MSRIMRSEHQNGTVTGNGALTEQALHASELSCRRLFEAAQDGNLITDRKRVEETVRESGCHFQTLTAISLVGIFRTDAPGQTRQ